MKKLLFIFSAFAVSGMLGWSPQQKLLDYDKKISKKNEDLEAVRRQIEKKIQEQNEFASREKDVSREIDKLLQNKKSISTKIKKLNSEITSSVTKASAMALQIERIHSTERELSDFLAESVRGYYVSSGLLQQRYSPYDLQAAYERACVDYSAESISRIREARRSCEKEREKLSAYGQKLASLKTDKQKEKELYDQMERQKSELKERLAAEKTKNQAELDALRKNAALFEELLSTLHSEKKIAQREAWQEELAKKNIAQLKGKLAWPLHGRIISCFGKQPHPELDTYVCNNGIRIQASAGEPVRAIAPGRVAFAGTFKGYGSMVILDHGGGYYSVYANLGRILVREKQDMPLSGQLGMLNGEALYFEFRSRGTAEDPLAWLTKE